MKKVHYGDGGTIHQSGEVNVELNKYGQVVSVWFRCLALPFTQSVVDWGRVDDMEQTYKNGSPIKITAVEYIEDFE